jgi:hypothetical protein
MPLVMQNPILSLLADAKARLERADRKVLDAERERDIARGQVVALQDAVRAFEAHSAPTVPQKAAGDAQIQLPIALQPPTDAWGAVFRTLGERYPNGFGYDEIASTADGLNVVYKRPSLRTKMMNLRKMELVQSAESGRFQITERGMSHFSVTPKRNGEAEASPDADEVAPSSNLPMPD